MVAQTIPEDRPLTADDFMSLPMDDGHLYELLQGELILSPSPETNHQIISGNLYFKIRTLLQTVPFGVAFYAPTAVVLSKTDVVEPDVFVIRNDQRSQVTRPSFNGTPAIIFEILSPSNRRTDLQRKALLYAKAGVEEYWMVDPEKHRVLVQRLTATGVDTEIITAGAVTSKVLPELTMDLLEIFAD